MSNLKKFFTTDYVDQACYDNLRKISSLVDGLKNSSRKVIWTILKKPSQNKLKVQQISAQVSEYTQYLHGSLDGVVVNLAQDFTESNNLPLLEKKGNFGTRQIPTASASRYIYAKPAKYLNSIYSKLDNDLLIEQYFEGDKIEPKYLVPIIPMLLVNGNNGLSSGFAQRIEPRNYFQIIEFIIKYLKKEKVNFNDLDVWYKGYKGKVSKTQNKIEYYVIPDVKVLKNKTQVTLNELPIGLSYQKFLQHLDQLQDDKVLEYQDLTDDEYLFNITFKSQQTQESVENILNLRTKVTENLTAITQDNKVKVYNDINELTLDYIAVRLDYYDKRKTNLLKELAIKVRKLKNIIKFIEMDLDLKTLNDTEINNILTNNFDLIDDSYNYLLNLTIKQTTKSNLVKLKKDLKESTEEFQDLYKESIENLWIKDLEQLKTEL